MSLRRADHCGNPEPHDAHNNGTWDGPHCDGNPESLARQQEREANPPPGPPSPPKPDWWGGRTPPTGPDDTTLRLRVEALCARWETADGIPEPYRGLMQEAAEELRSALAARDADQGAGDGPGEFWTQAEWQEWSDHIAELMPERYDGDEAQEALIERFVREAAARDADQGAGALAIDEALTEAWQDGYDAARDMARRFGHTDSWEDEPDNPFAALARATPEAEEGSADG